MIMMKKKWAALSLAVALLACVLMLAGCAAQDAPASGKADADLSALASEPVSYTHLDVYKRQVYAFCLYEFIISSYAKPRARSNVRI